MYTYMYCLHTYVHTYIHIEYTYLAYVQYILYTQYVWQIHLAYVCTYIPNTQLSDFLQFVHQMNNRQLLTCADDRQVRHHDIIAKETIAIWNCSSARVKRLATVAGEPHLFWSAAEDGFVRYVHMHNIVYV